MTIRYIDVFFSRCKYIDCILKVAHKRYVKLDLWAKKEIDNLSFKFRTVKFWTSFIYII